MSDMELGVSKTRPIFLRGYLTAPSNIHQTSKFTIDLIHFALEPHLRAVSMEILHLLHLLRLDFVYVLIT